MEIAIYRRHSADCPQKADRYAPRCGCPLFDRSDPVESTFSTVTEQKASRCYSVKQGRASKVSARVPAFSSMPNRSGVRHSQSGKRELFRKRNSSSSLLL